MSIDDETLQCLLCKSEMQYESCDGDVTGCECARMCRTPGCKILAARECDNVAGCVCWKVQLPNGLGILHIHTLCNH